MSRNSQPYHNPLTHTERLILQLLALGYLTNEIAVHCLFSRSTVNRYLSEIYSKLYAKNRTHAVAIALEEGYIISLSTQPGSSSEALTHLQNEVMENSESSLDNKIQWRNTLTKREQEIFQLLSITENVSLTDRGLALKIGISEHTLKTHLRHIYQKLGVSNRSGAALLAVQAKFHQERDSAL